MEEIGQWIDTIFIEDEVESSIGFDLDEDERLLLSVTITFTEIGFIQVNFV